MNTAIIVAAGSGTRFGGDLPKQFVEIAGKPILSHTLSRFEECPAIDEIILVTSKDHINRSAELSQSFAKVTACLVGGETRADSVLNGLKRIKSDGIVAIHDGARPLVSSEDISATVAAAQEYGAACLVNEVTDTIKLVRGYSIVSTVDRTTLRRAVTPQAFSLSLLLRAYEENTDYRMATDESMLVEALGREVRAVDGGARNIKITRREDIELAEKWLTD